MAHRSFCRHWPKCPNAMFNLAFPSLSHQIVRQQLAMCRRWVIRAPWAWLLLLKHVRRWHITCLPIGLRFQKQNLFGSKAWGKHASCLTWGMCKLMIQSWSSYIWAEMWNYIQKLRRALILRILYPPRSHILRTQNNTATLFSVMEEAEAEEDIKMYATFFLIQTSCKTSDVPKVPHIYKSIPLLFCVAYGATSNSSHSWATTLLLWIFYEPAFGVSLQETSFYIRPLYM